MGEAEEGGVIFLRGLYLLNKMRRITNIDDLREIFKNFKKPLIGIGISAFSRLGPEKFISNYHIVCLANGRDLELIKRDVKVLSAEELNEKNLKIRRNSSSLLGLEIIKKFLNSFDNPYLLFYKVTKKIKKLCNEEKWNIIGNEIYERIDNKALLRKILDKCGLPAIPGEICSLPRKCYKELRNKYGNKIVIQAFKGSGGKGTFFVDSQKDFKRAKEKILEKGCSEVVVTKFIEGPSPSLTGCVTKHGILYTNLQYQLLDIHEVMNPEVGNGVFCGHDWTSSNDFPEEIQKQAYLYARKIGQYLKTMGYKGIFGLDMIIDKKNDKIYVTEINPRLLGSFPVITMVQELNNEPLLIGFHILEFLEEGYDLDIEKVNKLMKKLKTGAHLILFNKYKGLARNRKSLKSGVYMMKDKKLKYLRRGYNLRDLKERGEFILVDSVPFENTVYKPHERILRIVTFEKLIDKKNYKLNTWAKRVVKKIYQNLDLVPA